MLELVSFFTTAIQILLKESVLCCLFVGIANIKKNASNPTRTVNVTVMVHRDAERLFLRSMGASEPIGS